MVRKNKVLIREDNRISLTYTKRITTQEDHRTITERKIPVNTNEQTWIFEIEEKTRVGRTTHKPVNTLARIIKWLNRLGSGKIDESRLESRHNIHHNITIKRIGL